MSEIVKLETFIGQKVRVRHPRFSGIGVLSRVEPAREAIAWVTLEHGEDRWYEASTVLPLNYSQKPIECPAPSLTPEQAAAGDMREALTLCEGLVIGWAVHHAVQGCTTASEYSKASTLEGWHPTHRAIYEKLKAALAKAGKP